MPKTRIPSQAEYDNQSLAEATQHEREIERAPLADRKEAQQSFFEAMRDSPENVGERLSWLLAGNYGRGAMMRAQQVVKSPRMNRRAALCLMTGVFEWMCPSRMGADAWKKLTPAQKQVLDQALDIVIAAAERSEE